MRRRFHYCLGRDPGLWSSAAIPPALRSRSRMEFCLVLPGMARQGGPQDASHGCGNARRTPGCRFTIKDRRADQDLDRGCQR